MMTLSASTAITPPILNRTIFLVKPGEVTISKKVFKEKGLAGLELSQKGREDALFTSSILSRRVVRKIVAFDVLQGRKTALTIAEHLQCGGYQRVINQGGHDCVSNAHLIDLLFDSSKKSSNHLNLISNPVTKLTPECQRIFKKYCVEEWRKCLQEEPDDFAVVTPYNVSKVICGELGVDFEKMVTAVNGCTVFACKRNIDGSYSMEEV